MKVNFTKRRPNFNELWNFGQVCSSPPAAAKVRAQLKKQE